MAISKALKLWQRVWGTSISGDDRIISGKSNILLTQMTMVMIFTIAIHSIRDLIRGSYTTSLILLGVLTVFLIILLINETSKHQLAKYLFFIFVNSSLFTVANIFPKERGIYLVFYPIILLGFAIGDEKRMSVRFLYAGITISLLAILELFDYQVFGEINVNKGEVQRSYLINMFASAILILLTAGFLIRNNRKAEAVLKSHQEKFKVLAKEIEQKNIVLSKTNAELDRFVYSTSHDLRSPLKSILGLVNIAKYEKSRNNLNEYFDKIENRISRLDMFISDILDYSKNSRLEVFKESTQISKLIENTIEEHKYLDDSNEIEFDLDCDIKENVQIDKGRLSVILKNLISNAIKYHDPKKSISKIEIRARKENGFISIQISDNGYGISNDDKHKIFDMFYRASVHSNGSGLGLYIVRETVEKLQGKIELTSTLGIRSDFKVTVPV